MKGYEIRDFCGDYALDIPIDDRSVHTIFFNSYRNAKTVKRIMEVDDSVSNAATVCDMVEVVRCRDCKFFEYGDYCSEGKMEHSRCRENDYCSYGERKEQA